MNIIKAEKVNITNIFAVNKYIMSEEFVESGIPSHYSTNMHTYELIFYICGSVQTHFCGVDITDKENSLRYLPKGSFEGKHTVRGLKPGYCIGVNFDAIGEMSQTAIGIEDIKGLKDKFIKIYALWSEKKPGFYYKAMSVFYEIINHIQNHQTKYITTAQRNLLANAIEYIHTNFCSREFDYNRLCSLCNLSYSYFFTLFKSQYNMSPRQYVTKMKIDYAKELLMINRYNISEIAELCGFENVYYFSNVFKKQVGISPMAYIKNF